MEKCKCQLCEKPAKMERQLNCPGEPFLIKCQICGDYIIPYHLYGHLGCPEGTLTFKNNEKYEDAKKKMRVLAYELKLKGKDKYILVLESPPEELLLGEYRLLTFKEFFAAYPKHAYEYFDRALLNLSRSVKTPDERATASNELADLLLFGRHPYMSKQLEEMGYIEFTGTLNEFSCIITAEGWQRIAELEETSTDSKQGFIAMRFSDHEIVKKEKADDGSEIETKIHWNESDIYSNGLYKGINDAGYAPSRIDEVEYNESIPDEIIAEIRRSKFVVADFTGQNNGVYYEAGFARGLGIEVIWTIHEDDIGNLHFDTQHMNHITYKTAKELKEKLTNRIRATIV